MAGQWGQVQLGIGRLRGFGAFALPTTGMMEITLPGGALIRVDAAVDGAALGRVLAALTGR